MSVSRIRPPLKAELPTDAVAAGWIGWQVDDLEGAAIGRVERVIASGGGLAGWLVINAYRLGDGARYAVPTVTAVAGQGRVWVPYERVFVLASAELLARPGRHTPEAEQRLRAHYAAAADRAA